MTCIVGLEHDGRVYMGADSIATDGFTKFSIRNPKIFKRGELLVGYTASFRMGQLLQYDLKIPKHKKHVGDMGYMVSVFAAAVRKLFKDNGWMGAKESRDLGGNFLIAYRGALYEMQGDFSVLQSMLPYHAVGAGEYHAVAAMSALPDTMPPKKRIKRALEVAALHTGLVSPKFKIMSISKR